MKYFATSPSFRGLQFVIAKSKLIGNKVHYLPQYAEEFYRPIEKNCCARDFQMMEVFKIAFYWKYRYCSGVRYFYQKTAELLKNENIKFVIVGDGRYQEELKREIEKTRCAETVSL